MLVLLCLTPFASFIFLPVSSSFDSILHICNVLSGPVVALRAFAPTNLHSDYLRGSDDAFSEHSTVEESLGLVPLWL